MRHHEKLLSISFVMLMAAAPAAAQSYGGGGLVVQRSTIDWDVPNQIEPNQVSCVGAVGYGVRRGKRAGGEGHVCSGPYTNMVYGGAQFGLQSKRGGWWLNAYNSFGIGWVGVHGIDSGRFDSMFVYTRPTVGAGVGIGHWAGLEVGAFANLPLSLVGVVHSDVDAKIVFPHVGLQATLLFGNFSRQPKPRERRTHRPRRPRDDRRPPPSRRDQGPLQPGDLPRACEDRDCDDDDRPLAIPG